MKLTIIHTTMATVSTMPKMIAEMYNDKFEIVNVLDDSMLNEIKAKGNLTKEVIQRFVQYCIIAEQNKSDAILLACSSIGEAGTIARKVVNIPLFKIDEPMANMASKGKNILVLGTVQSTLKPSCQLIESMISPDQKVSMKLIPNVFDLYSTNKELHDQKIAEVVKENASEFDTVVLAQASMAGAKNYIGDLGITVLTSLPLGLEQLQTLI